MDYGSLISGSFEYTKDALWGKWGRWILLVVLSLIQVFTLFLIPLYNGYIVRVLAGRRPAPDVDQWGRLFIDGWKWNIISLIYMIPVLLILAYFGGLAVLSAIGVQGATDPAAWAPVVAAALSGILLAVLVAILISFIALFAVVRFAHTGRFGEAFNFSAIFAHIGRIGWLNVFVALVVLTVVVAVVEFALILVPIIGVIILLLLMPAFIIFTYRYITLIYESAPAPA